MRRTTSRTLAAAAAAAALILTAGCSLIPGLGGGGAAPPAPPASPAPSAAATGTKTATSTPAVSKTSSGTAIPVPSVPKQPDAKISSDIDGVELRELQGKGALVVDLRSKADYAKEHVKGAVNVPMPDFSGTAIGWPVERTVVLYDRTGAVSQSAQTWLEEKGFTRIYHLFRGLEGYDATLEGDSPTPIPPRRPVLYYFTIDVDDLRPGQPLFGADRGVITQADEFVEELQAQMGNDFEFHSYDITTSDGLGQFQEFEGTGLPMFRLVTHSGKSEQFTGSKTFETVRSHLSRSIEEYKADTQP